MYIFGSHLIDLVISILGEPKNVVPFIKQTGFEGIYSDDTVLQFWNTKKQLRK